MNTNFLKKFDQNMCDMRLLRKLSPTKLRVQISTISNRDSTNCFVQPSENAMHFLGFENLVFKPFRKRLGWSNE